MTKIKFTNSNKFRICAKVTVRNKMSCKWDVLYIPIYVNNNFTDYKYHFYFFESDDSILEYIYQQFDKNFPNYFRPSISDFTIVIQHKVKYTGLKSIYNIFNRKWKNIREYKSNLKFNYVLNMLSYLENIENIDMFVTK